MLHVIFIPSVSTESSVYNREYNPSEVQTGKTPSVIMQLLQWDYLFSYMYHKSYNAPMFPAVHGHVTIYLVMPSCMDPMFANTQ